MFRIEYNGSGFAGWQIQPDSITVQGRLQHAFSTIFPNAGTVTGAGRTDAGVHALAQAAHVDIDKEIDDINKCVKSVTALAGSGIAIYDMRRVPDSFHARYSAYRREYEYRCSLRPRPLFSDTVWHVPYIVDWKMADDMIHRLVGTHDFGAFCAAGSETENKICTIYEASLTRRDDLYIFSVAANRFLYKMVRTIVGTVIDIARGRLSSDIDSVLCNRTRMKAGNTAPAKGLILNNVEYPSHVTE